MEDLNKIIWVKRIYTGDTNGKCIQMQLRQFNEIKKDNYFHIQNNKPIMATYKRMPNLYGWYRYLLVNKEKAIWVIVTAIIAAILGRFFSK